MKATISGVTVEVKGSVLTQQDEKAPRHLGHFPLMCSVLLALSAEGISLPDEKAQALCDTIEDAWSNIDDGEGPSVPMCHQVHITLKGYCGEGDHEKNMVANVTLGHNLLGRIFQARKLIKKGVFKKVGVDHLNTHWFADIEETDPHATTADLVMVHEKRCYLHSLSKHGNERYTSEGIELDTLYDLAMGGGHFYRGTGYDEMVEEV